MLFKDLPLEFPDGTTPVASHMYIYYGADWTTATPVPISTLVRNIQESNSPSNQGGRFGEGKTELERVVAKVLFKYIWVEIKRYNLMPSVSNISLSISLSLTHTRFRSTTEWRSSLQG